MVLVINESVHFSRKICVKNDFHISAPVTLTFDLDLWPCDLKAALPVTPHVGNHNLP